MPLFTLKKVKDITMNNKKTKDQLRQQLIHYLKEYLSKRDLNMKFVMIGILEKLQNHQDITPKQFDSILNYISRERPYRGMPSQVIREHFSELISESIQMQHKEEPNDLTRFFN